LTNADGAFAHDGDWRDGETHGEGQTNVGCQQGDCENGKGVYDYGDGYKYDGQWKDVLG
jgi:hypothetical protein